MKFSSLGLMAGLAASAVAEDLLFVDQFEYDEYTEATTTLGYTVKVVTEAEWSTMTTSDFAAFKAIVIADPDCSYDPTEVDFLANSSSVWGPAVQGNIVLIGIHSNSSVLDKKADLIQEPILPSMTTPDKPEL
jgi:hypothetical protein